MVWTWRYSEETEKSVPAELVADIADLGCRWSVFVGECVNTNVYQQLLRQHLFP
jgi:hypothetical protein